MRTDNGALAFSGSDPVSRLAFELRELRRQSGKTLRELEALIHASDSALSRYLAGRTVPPWPVVESLCRLTGQDPRHLHSLWTEARGKRAAGPQSRDNSLPRGAFTFIGRAAEAAAVLGAGDVVAIDGMAGVGKSALAIHVAHSLEDEYPDGQLLIDLHGHTPGCAPLYPTAALRTLLRTLKIPSHRIPDDRASLSSLWRAELGRRRLVVVLDNALSAEQIEPLLPGRAGSKVLLTGRSRFTSLGALPSVSLDVPPATEAAELFVSVAGEERVRSEPGSGNAVMEVVHLCGRLPLGVCLSAVRLRNRPAWTVAYLASRLRAREGLVRELGQGSGQLVASLAASLRDLDDETLRLFRALGLGQGANVGLRQAARLIDHDLDMTDRLLETLLDRHLLEQEHPDHYKMHPITRAFAAHLLAACPAEERPPVAAGLRTSRNK